MRLLIKSNCYCTIQVTNTKREMCRDERIACTVHSPSPLSSRAPLPLTYTSATHKADKLLGASTGVFQNIQNKMLNDLLKVSIKKIFNSYLDKVTFKCINVIIKLLLMN